MDTNDSPLFKFPTAQGKHFHSASTSTSSLPVMNSQHMPDFLAIHQINHGYDQAHPMLHSDDISFDTVLDPAMLHGAYVSPSAIPAPHLHPAPHLQQSQLIPSSNHNLPMILGPHQMSQIQNHQFCYPRSVPSIHSPNTMESPNGLHPLSKALAAETFQQSMDLSAQKTVYPLEELEDDHTYGRSPMSSFEVPQGAERDYLSSDAICQDRIYRSSATPFGESDIGSGCEEFPLDRDEPYAQRIYRCLKEAPNHTMVLKDIYKWFTENTDKGKDPNVKGWQNSIRHNLSMNKAFNKIELPPEKDQKKRFVWQLSEQALREGVQSTTRFRNKQPNKRGTRSHVSSLSRVASGQKGGEAARRTANLRRSERINEARMLGRIRSPASVQPNFQYTSVPPSATSSPCIRYDEVEGLIPSSSSQFFNGQRIGPVLRTVALPYEGMAQSIQTHGFINNSYPNSPDFPDQPEVHFLPLGDGPLFSDSPESSSEPHTPSTHIGDMAVDNQPFLGLPSDSTLF